MIFVNEYGTEIELDVVENVVERQFYHYGTDSNGVSVCTQLKKNQKPAINVIDLPIDEAISILKGEGFERHISDPDPY